MKSELIKGDSLQELKKYDDNSIDLLFRPTIRLFFYG